MSLAEFNRTILDYLTWSGQEHAAISFWRELGEDEPFDIERATSIIAMKDAVKRHDFAQAWQLALDIDGTRLVAHPEVEICFALAQLIEALATNQPPLAVIEQAKHTVVPLIQRLDSARQRSQFDQMLEHLVSLLILPQSNPPVKALLDPQRLEQWVLLYIQDFLCADQNRHNKFANYVALYECMKH